MTLRTKTLTAALALTISAGGLAWAQDRRMPVYVRGRGTNLVGDCVPVLPTSVPVSVFGDWPGAETRTSRRGL